jgi:hydroxymethylbilane synthase
MPSPAARSLRIGTRGSPLALWQAREVQRLLLAAHPGLRQADVEIVVIKTTGDRVQDRNLASIGGKGLFTKEIEDALKAETVDLAVHSLKDVPTVLPDGLGLAAVLEREDTRDVLIGAKSIAELSPASAVGTSSLRRKAQLLHRRPGLRIVDLRGNVETRLKKVTSGQIGATLLAAAGLKRLGIKLPAHAMLEPEDMLPAVGQGAIAIECRMNDRRTLDSLAPLDHAPSARRVAAERALLARLDGSCRTPIAALAELEAGELYLRAAIVRPDGSELIATARRGAETEAERMGDDAGEELKRRGGPDFFAGI